MRRRPSLTLCGLVVTVLAGAVGCAKPPEPVVGVPPPSTLDLVAQHGELRVCSTGDNRPFSTRDAAGRWSGTDVELAGDLAARLGVRLTLVPTTWEAMLDDLGADHCDLIMSGVSVTLDRARRAAFSQPYLTESRAPVTRCADAVRFATPDALDRPGVRVAVAAGPGEGFARDRLRRATVAPVPAPAGELLAGKADVVLTDVADARNLARLNPGRLCAVNPDRPLLGVQKAYLLPRGDVVFQQYVDTWLRLAQADGTLARAGRPVTG
jgi:cyclohexadienyl dehydratase